MHIIILHAGTRVRMRKENGKRHTGRTISEFINKGKRENSLLIVHEGSPYGSYIID